MKTFDAVIVGAGPAGMMAAQFSPLDTLRFFQIRNVRLKIEQNNAVFPVTDKSETIRCCLEEEMKKKHILYRHATVQDIRKIDDHFTITAQEGSFTTSWKARFVILATGGKTCIKNSTWLVFCWRNTRYCW